MPTRCQIGFYETEEKDLNNFEALLYRHSDGYQEDVLPEIIPFLKQFNKNRGCSDLEYCSARLLQHMCNKHDEALKEFKTSTHQYTGYGICGAFHGDIEFFYAVHPNRVDVYKVTWTSDPRFRLKPREEWKLLKTIDITK